MGRAEALAEREAEKIEASKLALRDGILKRINAAGSLLVAANDQMELSQKVGFDELSVFAQVNELMSGCIQMTLVHCQSEQVAVASPGEQSVLLSS